MRKSIYKIAAILLSSSILLSFSGCGKSELDDLVYVDETNVDDNVSDEISDELSDGASSNNNEFNDSTVEKLHYGNSLDIRGTKVTIDIDSSDFRPEFIPSYKAKRSVYDSNKEKKLVDNLFGNTAKSIDVDILDYLKKAEDLENHSDMDIVHVYEGSYNGLESRLTYIYTAYNHRVTMEMHPLDYGSIIGEPENRYLSYYFRDVTSSSVIPESETRLGGYNDMTAEHGSYESELSSVSFDDIEEINKNLKDLPNRFELSFNDLYDTAYDFATNTLGYTLVDDYSLSVYTYGNINYNDLTYYYPYSEIAGKLEGDFITQDDSCVTELVFSNKYNLNLPADPTDKLIKDGYQVNITNLIAGVMPVIDDEDIWGSSNMGWINITDKGIIGFDITYCYELEEILSENVQLLDFNILMECFEKELTDHLNTVDIGLSNIRFEHTHLIYYGIESPDDSNEVTFIPAWDITGYNNGMPCLDVILNAVDGSIIRIE